MLETSIISFVAVNALRFSYFENLIFVPDEVVIGSYCMLLEQQKRKI
jgi:hypothetical protein